MNDLFGGPYEVPLDCGDAFYHPAPDLGICPDALFDTLRKTLPWEQYSALIHDRVIPQPRLSSWHGEVIHSYATLAQTLVPHPWTPTLLALKARVEIIAGIRFNSMLANRYRDGNDAIGWHSDDEPELGAMPVIASLSLGEERRFDLRRRDDHARVSSIVLGHGSLLVMAGTTQRHWQHRVARSPHALDERINLTFRFTRTSDHHIDGGRRF